MSLKSNYRDGDSYSRKSKKEGYRSRASYKLKEILEKEIKVSKDQSVIDLGSFPGGWSQVIKNLLGHSGKLVAIDIQPMEPIKDCFFLEKPIEDIKAIQKLEDIDPINHLISFEKYIIDPNEDKIKDIINSHQSELKHETFLELAIKYFNRGLKEEAVKILKIGPQRMINKPWLNPN